MIGRYRAEDFEIDNFELDEEGEREVDEVAGS